MFAAWVAPSPRQPRSRLLSMLSDGMKSSPSAPSSTVASFTTGGDHTVFLRNGEPVLPKISKDELLTKYHGAYTTARTVDRHKIFELDMHCSRLFETGIAVLSNPVEDGAEGIRSKDSAESLRNLGLAGLSSLVKREIRSALDAVEAAWSADHPKQSREFQVTLLLTADTLDVRTPPDRQFDVFAYVQPLPYIAPMVDVIALRAERDHPTIKDVQWVRDRQALEAEVRKAGANECVMFDSDGHISEGLQTNFFAISADGSLITAPDELVLGGTVRKVVLEVAEQLGIPVRLETPNVKDVAEWDSCFICSTSRLVKPISHFSAPALGLTRDFPSEGSEAHRIEEAVLHEFRKHAGSLDIDSSSA